MVNHNQTLFGSGKTANWLAPSQHRYCWARKWLIFYLLVMVLKNKTELHSKILQNYANMYQYVTSLVRNGVECRRAILWPCNWERLQVSYKHVCVNYLHVASPVYQKVIQHAHTHPHTHSFTESFYFLSLYFHLSFNTNSSGEWKFQILLNQKDINRKHVISRQKKGLKDTKVRKANLAS